MLQILHIPGIQYANETREQAEERDRRIIEANRKLREEWEEGERQRGAPMKSMQEWFESRGGRRTGPCILCGRKFDTPHTLTCRARKHQGEYVGGTIRQNDPSVAVGSDRDATESKLQS